MGVNTAADTETSRVAAPVVAVDVAHRRTTVALGTVIAALALVLGLLNLTLYPRTWFDEGSHLHVPKAVLRYGAYADYSSDGLRYYGPTLGVGPTVLVPITAVFKVFGEGLFQARLVVVAYFLLGLIGFYLLARQFMTPRAALIAVALLLTARGVGYVEYGRQVLGEVPGLALMILGFWVWFGAWTDVIKPTRDGGASRSIWQGSGRLVAAGILIGLSAVTKNQYLLVLAPTLLLAWVANLFYYRDAPQRVFLITGTVTALVYLLWQVVLLVGLGPGNVSENLQFLREATAGAALVFSPERTAASLTQLLSARIYLGALVPGVVYGVLLALPRRRDAQQWGVLVLFVVVNLGWFALASIGWIRYAFPALALACLLVTRFFYDLTIGFWWPSQWRFTHLRSSQLLRMGLLIWLIGMLASSAVLTIRDVAFPPPDSAGQMSAVLNATVPLDEVVETWEPEMGFLTDHRYHYPPSGSLNRAVAHIWLGGPSPAVPYLPELEAEQPPYVLEGEFSRWVEMYPADWLSEHYTLVSEVGPYRLYERNP